MATAKRQFLLPSALCARNAVDCSLFLLRLAAKSGPRCSFSQPCRSGRRSTRYSRNNLGVAARNFASTERTQGAFLLCHYWLLLPSPGEFVAALSWSNTCGSLCTCAKGGRNTIVPNHIILQAPLPPQSKNSLFEQRHSVPLAWCCLGQS